jgi:hypothetical protein
MFFRFFAEHLKKLQQLKRYGNTERRTYKIWIFIHPEIIFIFNISKTNYAVPVQN